MGTMRVHVMVVVVFLSLNFYVQSLPTPVDGDRNETSGHSGGDEMMEFLELEKLARKVRRANATDTLARHAIFSSEKGDMLAQASNKVQDGIRNVLKALNLPLNFGDQRPSSSNNQENKASTISITTSTPTTLGSSTPTLPPLNQLVAPVTVFASTNNNNNNNNFPADTPTPMFMTGNAMLDKIMSCPCPREKLQALGIKGVAYSNQPNPDIYRDPPYGPDMPGPGDVIATNLKSVGGNTGNVFGQIIRLLLSIPTWAIALLKPLVVGLGDTLSQTTEAAAEVTASTAKQLPVVIRSTAVVIKRLLETFGDVTGSLLHVFSNLVASVAAAKTSVAGTLPFAFDAIGDLTKMLSGAIGSGIDFVSGLSEILSGGIVNAAKTGGNLFSGIVEGGKGFTNGLLEGVKYGINDETPPVDPNASAWKKR